MIITGIGALWTGDPWIGTLLGGVVMTTVEGVVLWKVGQALWRRMQDQGELKERFTTWAQEQGAQVEDRSQAAPPGEATSQMEEDISSPEPSESPERFSPPPAEPSPGPAPPPEPEPDVEERASEPSASPSLDSFLEDRSRQQNPSALGPDAGPSAIRGAVTRALLLNVVAWGVVVAVYAGGWMTPSGDGLVVLALPVAALGIAVKEVRGARREQT